MNLIEKQDRVIINATPLGARVMLSLLCAALGLPLLAFGYFLPAELAKLDPLSALGLIIAWSAGCTLIWHGAFAGRKTYLDKRTGEWVDKVSALYPIAERRLPVSQFDGVSVRPSLKNQRKWLLALVQGQNSLIISWGGEDILLRHGQKLADYMGKPLVREASI